MIVILNGQQKNINEGTTLQGFLENNNCLNDTYIVNGESVPGSTVLASYNVIESDPSGNMITADRPVGMVDVDLTDFTGQSGVVSIENSLEAVRMRYENNVDIAVIRDNQTIETEILQTGDRVMVTPNGGIQGACH